MTGHIGNYFVSLFRKKIFTALNKFSCIFRTDWETNYKRSDITDIQVIVYVNSELQNIEMVTIEIIHLN